MLQLGRDGPRIDWRAWEPTIRLVPDPWGHKFMGGPPDIPEI